MLEREFRIAIRQFGLVMAFLAVMPLVYALDSSFYRTGVGFTEYMTGGYGLLLMVSTFYLGYNIFSQEDEDGSLEYLLSLPVGRWQLLSIKVVPRVVILFLAAELGGLIGVQLIPGREALISFVLFSQICGFVLGIVSRRSWISRLSLFLLVLFTYFINSTSPGFHYYILPVVGGSSWIPYLMLEMAILLLILLPVYSHWDMKPASYRESMLARLVVGPLIILAIPLILLI
jgi:hypothetical protein